MSATDRSNALVSATIRNPGGMFIAAILEGATLDCPVMRVLIVAFYFPPAGGGGVQRTLKFCKFLPEHGVEVHVLTPYDPKWFARDEHLLEAIPATTTVHRCRFLGPRSASRADALEGRSGLGRLGTEARFVYQRALIPDKAAPWLATAVPAGIGVVRRHDIDVIMSTSPPSSTHLVAEAIATATRRPFVADFRDSWLDNPHRRYDKAGVRAKRAVESRMAASVGRRATALTAATGSIAQEIGHLHPDAAHKTTVIENGADFDDFEQLRYRPNDRFTIVHAGSFFGQRSPRPFLQALAGLLDRRPDLEGRRPGALHRRTAGRGPHVRRQPRHRRRMARGGLPAVQRVDPGTAGGGRAAAADTARGRPRRHGAVGQGVRIRGRAPPDAGGGAPQRRSGQPDPLRRRRQRG